MNPRVAVALSALLLVSAGCLAPLPGDGTEVGGGEAATASSPTASATAAGGEQSAVVPARESPWGSDPVVVAVENDVDRTRAVAPLVRQAARYWEGNARRYAGYPVDFRVDPDAADPDVVVRVTAEVPDCGGAVDAVGCAPRITDRRQISRPETVWVRAGLSNESTVLVTEHEFGHLLGLGHDDDPSDRMAARSVLHTLPRPDATDRAFPWHDAGFSVYVADENVSDPVATRTQIAHALRYYERGAPGMPGNLSFGYVDDPALADVVVRFADSAPCAPSRGSCVRTNGPDPDGDGAIEIYRHVEIVVVGMDTDAVGWHVGYWLAYALGAEDDAEKPPPFRDADHRERRSEWWE